MKKLIVLLAGLAVMFGCSTIVNGTTQDMSVTADQAVQISIVNSEGAVVYEGGTPAEVSLPRAKTYTITVTADGFQTQTIQINQQLNGWFWGNCIIGGLLGWIVDGVSGAMWELDPSEVDVKMAIAMDETEAGPAVTLLTKDDAGEYRYVTLPLLQG
jgi:uncharacterized protein YceK